MNETIAKLFAQDGQFALMRSDAYVEKVREIAISTTIPAEVEVGPESPDTTDAADDENSDINDLEEILAEAIIASESDSDSSDSDDEIPLGRGHRVPQINKRYID